MISVNIRFIIITIIIALEVCIIWLKYNPSAQFVIAQAGVGLMYAKVDSQVESRIFRKEKGELDWRIWRETIVVCEELIDLDVHLLEGENTQAKKIVVHP